MSAATSCRRSAVISAPRLARRASHTSSVASGEAAVSGASSSGGGSTADGLRRPRPRSAVADLSSAPRWRSTRS
ncbi:Uncharacterised protein [Mycobacteroides abscessus]|nr:Uncharacterised protein [Mycobacteroides abscessus]